MNTEKWQGAVFVPYRRNANIYEFFLQKRDKNAPRDPSVYSLFGGKMESGENANMALERETKEELSYEPKDARFFGRYELIDRVFNVYVEEVGNNFESKVYVNEGEYGKFLNSHQVIHSPEVSLICQMIVKELSESLK